MDTAPESSLSLDRGEKLSLLLGAAVALLVSAIFLAHTTISTGGARWCRVVCCAREPADPVTRAFMDDKVSDIRRENVRGICAMTAFYGMVNCMLLIVHHAIAHPRWMTVGQDITIVILTLYAVGSHCWLKRAQKPLVAHLAYAGLFLISTCFVCLSSATQGIFALAVIACKFFQAIGSIAAMSPALTVSMLLLNGLCLNLAYSNTEPPLCEEAVSLSQTTFAVSEALCGVCIIVLTLLWKRFSISRISHELKWLISQSETTAARNLLNTVCDATVELDVSLRIVGDASRLSALLQHGSRRSLQGMDVIHFVIAEDQEKFRNQFVLAKTAADQDMAKVCNVRVRDSISNTVSVEIFIVSVANPLTCTSYLIGMREFTDSESKFDSSLFPPTSGKDRALAEALDEGVVSNVVPCRVSSSGLVSSPTGSGRQDFDGSSASGAALTEGCRGDKDTIAICVDVCSDDFEIKHATAGYRVFLGPRRKDNLFLRWLPRSEVEPFISWAQLTFNDMLHLRRFAGAPSPEPAVYPEELHFRPRAIGRARFGFASSVVFDIPPDEATETSARLTFTDVHLVRWPSEW